MVTQKKSLVRIVPPFQGGKDFLGIVHPGLRRVRLTLGYYVLPLQGNSATTLNAIIISNIMQTFGDKNFLHIIYWRKPQAFAGDTPSWLNTDH